MRKFRLILTSLMISALLAPQVFAEPADAGATPAASPVITAGGPPAGNTSALSTSTSVPSTTYQPGTYQAGVSIPAGEYVLLTQDQASSGYYIISTGTGEDKDWVDYCHFDYNAIIRLEDGQELSLQNCTASPIDEVPEIDHFYGGMYKIGYHIPAGTYRLKSTDSSSYGIGYILSYPSDNYDVVLDYMYVEDTAAITVEDGQYLQLLDCILAGTAPADSVLPNHGSPEESSWEQMAGDMSEPSGDAQRISPIVTAGTLIPGLPVTTSTPGTVYPEGEYQAGVDIPAGEYVLLGTQDSDADYGSNTIYMICSSAVPASMDDIIDYGTFDYNAIIRLEEGQFLKLSGCAASPIDEVPEIDYRVGCYFKVGYHIPAGTYQFISDGWGIACVLSAPGQRTQDLIKYELIYDKPQAMTVEDGQYLLLQDCRFTLENTRQAGPGGDAGGDSGVSWWETYLNYIMQLLGYEEEETSSPVITAPGRAEGLPTVTSVPSTVYTDGIYQAGTDIPAGEYMVLTGDTDSYYGYTYIISTTPDPDNFSESNLVDYNTINYNAIIRLEEGQYLHLSGCTASPIDEVPKLDYRRGEMFKVGYHIPAGTYRLKVNSDSYYGRAYILSYPSDSYEAVIQSMIVSEESDEITLKDGQYLQLKDCTLSETVRTDDSLSGPAFAAAPEADGGPAPE